MGKFHVYILESNKGFHYIGQTSDIEKRLSEHNSNLTKSTKNRRKWEVITSRQCTSRAEAMKLEHRLKKMKNWRKAKDIWEIQIKVNFLVGGSPNFVGVQPPQLF